VTYNTGNHLTDKYLVDTILAGNTQAFTRIIQTTEKLVTQIVFKMISHTEDRKDIVQDIYLKTFHKLTGFQFNAKLSTWIAQIAYNTCLDYTRKKKLLLPDLPPGNDDHNDSLPGIFHHLASPLPASDDIIKKDLALILKSEIDKLPPVYKTLITLYHNEELSYEEIGLITGLPSGTIKNYLFRARKVLKAGLLQHYKKEEL